MLAISHRYCEYGNTVLKGINLKGPIRSHDMVMFAYLMRQKRGLPALHSRYYTMLTPIHETDNATTEVMQVVGPSTSSTEQICVYGLPLGLIVVT